MRHFTLLIGSSTKVEVLFLCPLDRKLSDSVSHIRIHLRYIIRNCVEQGNILANGLNKLARRTYNIEILPGYFCCPLWYTSCHLFELKVR